MSSSRFSDGVVRQFVVPDMKRISFCLAQAFRFGIAGWFVDRRKMLAEKVNCALAGLQGEAFGDQKWLWSLRCDCITMVQPAESRRGLNLAFMRRADFCRSTCWRVLREPKMRPVRVIIE